MEKIFMLTIDGTSTGEYENVAFSLLFKTREEAMDYVKSDLSFFTQVFFTNVFNPEAILDRRSADDISKAIKDNCKWFNENKVQFRHGNAIRDYKIEEVSIPS